MAKTEPVQAAIVPDSGAQTNLVDAPEATTETITLESFIKELEDAGERTAGMFAHYYGNVKVVAEAAREEYATLFEAFKNATTEDLYPEIRNLIQY